MSKFGLYFSNEEMTDFLIKRGYNVSTAKCWYSQSAYQGKLDYFDTNVMIAYKEKEISFSDIEGEEVYSIETKYGLENVFEKEVKKSILGL